MNVAGQMQFKNAVERILHVPGNYTGGILEMALVCDYHMPQEQLCQISTELIDCLKRNGEVFRNVRLNLVKWVDDSRIIKEIVPMTYVRMGRVFEDYALLCSNSGVVKGALDMVGLSEVVEEIVKSPKTMQELTRQLKLFYARSKVIIVITDGSYEVGDKGKTRENLHPFLYRKLLFCQNEKVITGMEWMRNECNI